MPWTFQETRDDDVSIVLTGIQLVLNRLTPDQALSVKTAASDQKDGMPAAWLSGSRASRESAGPSRQRWTGEQ